MNYKNLSDGLGWKFYLAGFFIITFFIIITFFTQRYQTQLIAVIAEDNLSAIFLYVAITTIAIIIAPISTLPLMPLAVGIWGWFVAGLLSIIGWTIGSQIAFFIARYYGKQLVEKIISLEQLGKLENRFGTKNLFWTVVFLRMTVPVDILSYALGIFSNISTHSFFLATIIGITPFAFIFSYLGSLNAGFQIISLTLISSIIFTIYFFKQTKFYK